MKKIVGCSSSAQLGGPSSPSPLRSGVPPELLEVASAC
jgi:hypothetical protein